MFAVPLAGVPASAPVPGVNDTPVGRVPVSERDGGRFPVAVTVKLPALNTVNVALLLLVMLGATSAAVGVTMTLVEAGPVNAAALVAVIVQVYCVLSIRPVTTTGEVLLAAAPLGVQLAL